MACGRARRPGIPARPRRSATDTATNKKGSFTSPSCLTPTPPLLHGRPLGPSARMEVPVQPRQPHYPNGKKAGAAGAAHGGGQRWLPVHVLQDWRQGNASDQESYAESTDGWSSANCSTLPPPMSKIPADRTESAAKTEKERVPDLAALPWDSPSCLSVPPAAALSDGPNASASPAPSTTWR
ncbi:hypothetical protein SKAU_G00039350 [Synaphobranchus kaupii]|uniref:Uncharacterized protein n=1 Tax=Synaphobranchus kaupii TaxID=118154 RepID=A0A9Q1JHH3_SYNKA|nr:hypothetical protein SKAU_G00039350 [Synaphobranchus kaupii]